MSEFCIIGSGISGATIANLLIKKYSVILFDKARGPGGRASFKRIKGKTGFDHGTQYISPKTREFKKFTKEFPTLRSLSKSSETKILKFWEGLGYYNRARNLLFTVREIVNKKKEKLQVSFLHPGF